MLLAEGATALRIEALSFQINSAHLKTEGGGEMKKKFFRFFAENRALKNGDGSVLGYMIFLIDY